MIAPSHWSGRFRHAHLSVVDHDKTGFLGGHNLSITVNIYYSGKNGAARRFAEEMMSSGTVAAIRDEKGNLQYEYFYPVEDTETVLLIDSWASQDAIDMHHRTPMMQKIIELRDKYDLHMRVFRFVSDDVPQADHSFIRK